MLSAIFQPEVNALESQVATLQAQIAAHVERISLLNEAELVTGGSLEALKGAIEKVSSLAPNAISSLRTAVLNLFNSGDDQPGDDGNGNQPINPDPQPGSDGGAVVVDFDPYKYLNSSCPTYFDHYWETAEPDGSSWEIMSPLVCQLEDCPESALTGQFYELACDREDKSQQFCELVKVSPAVAYQRRHDGEIICVYAGFGNKATARRWGEWLCVTHSVGTRFEVREAKRLTDYRHELKLWGLSIKQIERLAGCDLAKDPRSCFSAPVRQPARTTPRACEIDDIGVGDRIRSVTVKTWQYTVLALREDGTYDCERIGVTPAIRLVLHPASVELVCKAATKQEASIEPLQEQPFIYSVLESSNLGQKLSVSRLLEGKQQFLGSVSCGTNTERWSHSRQPKYGQNIPYFASKESAAISLVEAYKRDTAPRLAVLAGIEPDF